MTFADTMSLLMGFFALLISFATFDDTRFKKVQSGVQAVFGGASATPQPTQPALARSGETATAPSLDTAPDRPDELRAAIEAWDRETKGAMALRPFESYRGVEATLPADRLFEPGTDRLTPHALGLARFLSQEMSQRARSRKLVVEVPTEAAPPGSPQFEDAWALAMARAQAVAGLVRRTARLGAARVVPAAVGHRAEAAESPVTFLFERPEVITR